MFMCLTEIYYRIKCPILVGVKHYSVKLSVSLWLSRLYLAKYVGLKFVVFSLFSRCNHTMASRHATDSVVRPTCAWACAVARRSVTDAALMQRMAD